MKSIIFGKLPKIFTSLALILTLLTPFSALAQRRGAAAAKPKTAPVKRVADDKSESSCGVSWRGKIVYYNNVADETHRSWSNPSTGPKASGWEKGTLSKTVEGEIMIDGKNRQGKIKIDSKQTQERAHEYEYCCWTNIGGCTKKTYIKTHEKTVMAMSGGGEEKVDGEVQVTGNRYKISYWLPTAKVKDALIVSKESSGACNPEDNKNGSEQLDGEERPYMPFQITAEGTIDPKNPNFLQGSYQPDKDTMIRWELTRVPGNPEDCEGDLSLSGLKAEHHVFPNPTAWEEIGENTVDGNQVRLTATVSNGASKAKSGTVTFKEKTTGEVLGTQSVNVPAESEKEVQILWDTNGYGWTDERKKAPDREIEASLSNGETAETIVKVYPKPVILVHGLWSNAEAWSPYQGYMAEAHSFAWKAFAVGADPKHGKMNTGDHFGNYEPTNSIFQNAQELGKQIKFTQETENAWHVDVVAHSMGGLITRFYIHSFMKDSPDGKPVIKNLVMLGTPNMGSPWADIMFDKYARAGKHVEALNQLRTDECRKFNQTITNRKGVKFSIVYTDRIPFTGDSWESGDGVVSKSSAIWQISDISHSDSFDHTALTGESDFKRFVYPRLAAGPKKAKLAAIMFGNSNENYAVKQIGENWLASIDTKKFDFSNLTFESAAAIQTEKGKSVSLKPNETMEIEIPTVKGKRGGIAFTALPQISATLIDADGEIIGENLAETPEANGFFRYIVVDKFVKNGTWKLKLENTADVENNVIFVSAFDTNPLSLEFTEIQVQTSGAVRLQVKVTGENGAAIKGAKVTVQIQGQSKEIVLFDDGGHGDEEENDGIYGALTDSLAPAEYSIQAKVAASGLSAAADAFLTVSRTN
jgi:pimeloyl-ACP methyl ester carboxylesterase